MDRNYFITLAIVGLLLVSLVFMDKMTGFDVFSVGVSITEKPSGRISSIAHNLSVIVGSGQNIIAEFENTGSIGYDVHMDVKIYKTINNFTRSLATYHDSSSFVPPGGRKMFPLSYVPNETGIYYVQARGYFISKVAESWSAFYSIEPPVPYVPPEINFTLPPGGGGGGSIVIGGGSNNQIVVIKPAQQPGYASMDVAADASVEVKKGDSVLLPIKVTNNGEVRLRNLRADISTLSDLNIDVNPKIISFIDPDDEITFLVSLSVTNTTENGVYPLDYVIMSDQTQRAGVVNIVVSGEKINTDDIHKKITNYQVLILEVAGEVSAEKRNGYDMSDAELSLQRARASLDRAIQFYNSAEYEKARSALDDTKKNIEDAVLYMANSTMMLQETKLDLSVLAIIIVMIVAAVAAAYYFRRRKHEEVLKRPAMLQRASEEGG